MRRARAERGEIVNGCEFRHRRLGLAAAGQLGPHAQVPDRAGPGDDEETWARRRALHVRRERSLPYRHADAGLEQAQARAALCALVWRWRAGAVRAGRPRLSDRAAFALAAEGERSALLRLDQGRGRTGFGPA